MHSSAKTLGTVSILTAYPDNAELSRVSPHNPVYLTGMAIHAAWVNEQALRLAGITSETPDPPGGRIVKSPETGRPTGILLETATDLVSNLLPAETHETRKEDVRLSVRTALRLGLTEVHDAGTDDRDDPDLQGASGRLAADEEQAPSKANGGISCILQFLS